MADLDPNVDWAFVAKMVERFPGHIWIASIPELRDVLVRATREEWSPELFESNIRASNWWKTTAPKVREWTQLQGTDPAGAEAQIDAQNARVRGIVAEFGVGGDIDQGASRHIAFLSLSQGWTETQLRQAVADTWGPQPGTFSNVRGLAQQYLVDMTDQEAADWTRRVFTGELTADGLRQIFQTRASAKFSAVPEIQNLLKTGATPMDYFGDYVSMISRYTDTPVSGVDLVRDPEWSKILSHNDAGTIRPMTYAEASRYVRGTNKFAESRVGREETATFVDSLTTALGTRK